ncbi:MAG: hypothetical protein GY805_05605 [Chloroflexi bacterium]|nr:hypothetical protein [Chloroflexota bacterium]
MSDLTMWESSWQALDDKMKIMETTCQLRAAQGVTRMQTLHNLVKCLRVFAAGQFHFFYQGFTGMTLKPADYPRYPIDYVLRGVIYQIENDIEAVQRAITQRETGTMRMKDTLTLADQMAYDALKPALHGESPLIDGTPTVITYFQKFASIRLIPYASVALIGIPFTCTRNAKDFLAIPHEVGHFVFRRGENSDGTLRKQMGDALATLEYSPKYNENWMEEVFADVYGCLVAGATVALDFQDLQMEKSPDDFVNDDSEHPVPMLRPYLYTSVLFNISSQWSDKLRMLWDKRRKIRDTSGDDSFTTVNQKNKLIQIIPLLAAFSATNTGADLPVNHTLNKALELLPAVADSSWNEAAWWMQIRNTQMSSTISELSLDDVDNDTTEIQNFIYQAFQEKTIGNNIPTHTIPELGENCDSSDLDDSSQRQDFINNLVLSWPSPFFTVASPQDNWDKIWVADGWQTSGNGQWIWT